MPARTSEHIECSFRVMITGTPDTLSADTADDLRFTCNIVCQLYHSFCHDNPISIQLLPSKPYAAALQTTLLMRYAFRWLFAGIVLVLVEALQAPLEGRRVLNCMNHYLTSQHDLIVIVVLRSFGGPYRMIAKIQ